MLHQAEARRVPKGGGPTVAESDLVAVRQAEQLRQAGAESGDDVTDARLTMARAEIARCLSSSST